MKKYIFICGLILGITNNCICFAMDNNTVQISEKDQKIYNMRKATEGIYCQDLLVYHVDYVNRAEAFLKKKDFEKAQKHINLAIYYYDKNPLAYLIKAEIDLHNNNLESAKLNYQKACDIREVNIKKDRNGNEYIDFDNRLYDSETNNTMWVRMLKLLAKFALYENDTKLAQEYINEIRNNWETFDIEVLYIETEIAKAEGNISVYETSKKFLNLLLENNKKLEKQPNNAEIYVINAMCLAVFGEKEFAISSIDKAIKLSPNNSGYLIAKSQLYTNDDKEKLELLNKAVKINPINNPEVYIERAQYYISKEQYDNGLNDLQKAMQYGAKEDDLASFFGICYMASGEYEKALKYFTIANDEYLIAKALMCMEKYKEALDKFNRIKVNPDFERAQKDILECINYCKKHIKG